MPEIKLKTQSGTTEILIPSTIAGIRKFLPVKSTIVLVDDNVLRFHGEKLQEYTIIRTGVGEENKSLQNAEKIYGELIEKEVDRSWKLIGIGGGIATDLSGFVASTYLRGIDFGFISTTLLGQVDAAIGGKNGVNYKGFKNMVGTIRQPSFVHCDLEALRTLPENEFIGGFAEIIKYAAIKKHAFYEFLTEHIGKALEFDQKTLEYLVYESIQTKKEIVEMDEREQGVRKLLNFGHTFAHALEKNYKISHGEAVAIGMLLAAKYSANLGMVKASDVDALEELVRKAGLPVAIDFDPKLMAETIRKDKKRKRDFVQFILLEAIGRAIIKDVPVNELKVVFDDLR